MTRTDVVISPEGTLFLFYLALSGRGAVGRIQRLG